MKKILLFTGSRGVGKSTALAGIVPATKEAWGQTLVFDTEDSWSDLVTKEGKLKDVGFKVGEYVRAYDRFRLDEDLLGQIRQGKLPWVSKEKKSALLDYYKWFISALDDKLKLGKFNYVLIDTIESVEAALTAWAEANPEESGWSRVRAYGRLETEAVRPLYENLIEGIARRGVEYIGLTSHLRTPWLNVGTDSNGREISKPLLNKVEPGGRLKLLARISTMMVWLVHESKNEDGAPAGLILKARLSKMAAVDGHLRPRRVLPERMPHFSWYDVQEYIKTPADFASPKMGEKMSETEREMISELLNDEQFRLMLAGSNLQTESQPDAVEIPNNSVSLSLPDRIKAAKQNGEA